MTNEQKHSAFSDALHSLQSTRHVSTFCAFALRVCVGKPNPLIMRAALNKLQIKREEACIIGDRLDTDIQAGIQSEIHTVMVLTGVCTLEDVLLSPYRPDCILPSIFHVLKDGFEQDPESARRKI